MGLFDVARGAAAALSRSAFPLRGAAKASSSTTASDHASNGKLGLSSSNKQPTSPTAAQHQSRTSLESLSRFGLNLGGSGSARTSSEMERSGYSEGSVGEEQRVRKRDMLSSAVTGGLASGIGWVLGAKPVDYEQRERDRQKAEAERIAREKERDRHDPDWSGNGRSGAPERAETAEEMEARKEREWREEMEREIERERERQRAEREMRLGNSQRAGSNNIKGDHQGKIGEQEGEEEANDDADEWGAW
jgi:hypothetical protein